MNATNITASAVSICTGGNTTFTAHAIHEGTAAVYTWKINDVSVGINDTIYSSNTLVNGDIVSCELTSNAACVSDPIVLSNKVVIEALTPPSILITTTSAAICTGDSKTFIATPVGAGAAPFYQWKVNGLSVGTNNPSYTDNNFSNNDEVSCIMIPGTGSCSNAAVVSNVKKIVIHPLPNIKIFPADTIVLAGSQILECNIFRTTLFIPVAAGSGCEQCKFTIANYNSTERRYELPLQSGNKRRLFLS